MKENQIDQIEALLRDVRFNLDGIAYLKNFASWTMTFDRLDLKKNQRDLIDLAQLAAEFAKKQETRELARGLVQIVRCGVDRIAMMPSQDEPDTGSAANRPGVS